MEWGDKRMSTPFGPVHGLKANGSNEPISKLATFSIVVNRIHLGVGTHIGFLCVSVALLHMMKAPNADFGHGVTELQPLVLVVGSVPSGQTCGSSKVFDSVCLCRMFPLAAPDLGRIKARYEPLIFNDLDDAEDEPTGAPTAAPVEAVQRSSSLPEYRPQLVQEAFQPGSTPAHLQHRFMVWNSVGIVRAHNTAEESSVDVEFHDASVHHTLHRGNPQGHTMAALSSRALLLAGPQQLLCFHFGSWDSNKEWSLDVPPTDSLEVCGRGPL